MSELTVGCVRSNVGSSTTSKIYEVLLEKVHKDNAELADRLSGLELQTTKQLAKLEAERDEALEDAKAADEHRRLAEKLAEKAIFERDQLRLRIAELQNGIFVEPLK